MQIRKLDITDLENLQKISITTFRETFEEVNSEEDMQKYLDENLSLERLKSELENPDSEFYFIENKNKNLGYLKLNFGNAQTENFKKNYLEIERIYILKDFLGQKIGKILLNKAIEIGKKKNLEFLWLCQREFVRFFDLKTLLKHKFFQFRSGFLLLFRFEHL